MSLPRNPRGNLLQPADLRGCPAPVRRILKAEIGIQMHQCMKNALETNLVTRMDEAPEHALTRAPTPIVWEEEVKPVTQSAPLPEDEPAGAVAH